MASVAIVAAPVEKRTDATPTLSAAVAVRTMVCPGDAVSGAVSETVGGSASGAAMTVMVALADPLLLLGSVAVARTAIFVPGAATVGMEIVRWYGAGGDEGLALSMVNVSDAMPTLSTASAVTTTCSPGRACDGATRVTDGGARSTAGPTVTDDVAVCDAPFVSVTVSVIVNGRASFHVCTGAGLVASLPSPKLHAYVSASPSGSLEPRPESATPAPTVPTYGPPGRAVGARFDGGGGAPGFTVTLTVATVVS